MWVWMTKHFLAQFKQLLESVLNTGIQMLTYNGKKWFVQNMQNHNAMLKYV